jgi:hypothetical protein
MARGIPSLSASSMNLRMIAYTESDTWQLKFKIESFISYGKRNVFKRDKCCSEKIDKIKIRTKQFV